MAITQTLSQLLVVLGAAVGTAGYVYILGAAVLWIRLSHAGFPTEVPVSLAFRPELVVMGAQTLGIWLALATIIAFLLATAMLVRRHELWLTVAGAVFGAALGVGLWGMAVVGYAWPAIPALIFGVVPVFAAASSRIPFSALRASTIPAATVGIAAVGTCALLKRDHLLEAGLAWSTFAVLLLPALVLRPGFRRRQQTLGALATQEERRDRLADQAIRYAEDASQRVQLLEDSTRADELARTIRIRVRAPVDPAQRAVWRWWQWGALAIVGLLSVGGIALAYEARGDNGFQTAVVGLTGGRCVQGAYIAADSKQLILAGRHKDPITGIWTRRVVVIPAKSVRELQVRPPRAAAKEITVLSTCSQELVQGLGSSK
jgi:hypothetical protein